MIDGPAAPQEGRGPERAIGPDGERDCPWFTQTPTGGPWRVSRIVSGGQTGAERGGWLAAEGMGVSTGGFMPPEYWCEDVLLERFRVPFVSPLDYAARFNAEECRSVNPAARVSMNARLADVTLWFGSRATRWHLVTYFACQRLNRPMIYFIGIAESRGKVHTPEWLAEKIVDRKWSILNVSGDRESLNPGMEDAVEGFIREALGTVPRIRRRLGGYTIESHKENL